MKVAISSQGNSVESPVDQRFGRAKWFVLIDSDTGAAEPFGNDMNLNAAQGAGIQAAENVINLGAQCVITGHCGPKAFRTLKAAGVEVFAGAEGSVKECLEKFKRGELEQIVSPDVEGHWA